MFKFFCLFFTVILILSCRERDRNNPFDPHNDDEFIELGLSLHSTDSLITLSWNIPLKPDFSSFEIYKKEDEPSHKMISHNKKVDVNVWY